MTGTRQPLKRQWAVFGPPAMPENGSSEKAHADLNLCRLKLAPEEILRAISAEFRQFPMEGVNLRGDLRPLCAVSEDFFWVVLVLLGP